MSNGNRIWKAALALGTVSVMGCVDLTVSNPGLVEDDQLNALEAFPGLVGGMSGDLSVAVGGMGFFTALTAGELGYAGAYDYNSLPAQGIITPEFADSYWSDMQRARWVAESGIVRMQAVLGASYDADSLAARANLLAGYADRLLGENACDAVIDGGPKQPYTDYFVRAEQYFTEANRLALAAGRSTIATAAIAGRASVRAAMGDWAGAVGDASQVPVGFVYSAMYSTNTARENNTVVAETRTRFEASVYGSRWQNVWGDPRVPWDTVYDAGGKVRTARDGNTPVYRQKKYTDLGSVIPLSKGTEMLLIRAEAALRANDVPSAVARINEERSFYKLPDATPATAAEAWQLLQDERGAVLWLEARRFWDLRRWYDEGRDTFLDNRNTCIPIGMTELQANPNLRS